MYADLARTADVTIRTAHHEDIPSVLSVWERAASSAASTPNEPNSVARLIEHTEGALIVAEHHGLIVGVLIAAWDGWRGNMYRLAVLPDYRRCGIARQLIQTGHERLRELGALRVTALVAHDEVDATAVWVALGYARDKQLSRFVKNL